jgi:hypothetical protein
VRESQWTVLVAAFALERGVAAFALRGAWLKVTLGGNVAQIVDEESRKKVEEDAKVFRHVAHGKLAALHQELKEDCEKSAARFERVDHVELLPADLCDMHARLHQHAKKGTGRAEGSECRL